LVILILMLLKIWSKLVIEKIAQNYLNMFESNSFHQLITQPTRVTPTSSTIIDHIITNEIKYNVRTEVLNYCLTGHFPHICLIKTLNKNIYRENINNIQYFNLINFNQTYFCEELEKTFAIYSNDFEQLNKDNFNIKFDLFLSVVKSKINKKCTNLSILKEILLNKYFIKSL